MQRLELRPGSRLGESAVSGAQDLEVGPVALGRGHLWGLPWCCGRRHLCVGRLGFPHFPRPYFKPEVKGGGTHCVGRVTGRTVWYMQACGDAVLLVNGRMIGCVWLLTELPCRKVPVSLSL